MPNGALKPSEKLRVAIVDDEPLARQLLREYLDADGRVEVAAECANGFEAVKAIAEQQPDLVFLDIQMPKLDGFEVLELIDPGVAVIFVTAYDQYAMRAFEARAELAAAARPPEQRLERVVVRDGAKVHIVPVGKLDYVEAQDDYVCLHSEKKRYLKQQTISALEGQLDPREFVRVHRSYLVRLDKIARIEPYSKDSRVVVLTDGTQLPVSRAGHVRLKELLGETG